jgi:hypothetical protein
MALLVRVFLADTMALVREDFALANRLLSESVIVQDLDDDNADDACTLARSWSRHQTVNK